MGSMTVVHYTSNTEDEYFASRVRAQLVKAVDGRCPIISVSQKPIDLGKNICVGEVGNHDWNALRQLRIGIEEAKTKFIAASEADVLYPPEYFDFDPPTDGCYHYTNFYAMWRRCGFRFGKGFSKKDFSEGAQYAGRDYWLFQLDRVMKDGPIWMEPGEFVEKKLVFGKYGPNNDRKGWFKDRTDCLVPVVGIKTGRGLRQQTGVNPNFPQVFELPYWGTAHDLRVKYFGDCKDSCRCTEIKDSNV